MNMYNADVKNSPYLARFLKELGDRVKRKSKVWEAFKLYSTQTDDRTESALKWGTKPWVVPLDIGQRYGYYHPSAARDEVYIDHAFEWMLQAAVEFTGATWTEGAKRKLQINARPAAELLLEAKVLHEVVHWLDYTADDEHLGVEAGDAFEMAAYGKVLKREQPEFATVRYVFPAYFAP
jgi:Metallopeptidase toxin 3